MKAIPKGKEITGAITKHMDRRFLSSLDLLGKGEVVLTIDRVEFHEKLEFENGRSEDNVRLLYFQETPKPLAINVTNTNAVARLTGTVIAKEWHGEKIVLNVQKVRGKGGKIVDGVRVIGIERDGNKTYNESAADNINKKLRG